MSVRRAAVSVALAAMALGAVSSCESGESDPDTSVLGETESEQFPSIVSATAEFDEPTGLWAFDVTVSSPYDTPDRYADGWRVIGSDGTVYGTHTLTHDHADEQPFTRRQSGVSIPEDVTNVTIEGRDQSNGFGGSTVQIDLQTG